MPSLPIVLPPIQNHSRCENDFTFSIPKSTAIGCLSHGHCYPVPTREFNAHGKMTMSAYHLKYPKKTFFDTRIALEEYPRRALGRSGNMIGCGQLSSGAESGQLSEITYSAVGARSRH